MFTEPFSGQFRSCGMGYYTAGKILPQQGCTWLAITLDYPATLNRCLSFIKGPKYVPERKKTTHHCAVAWCVVWFMHPLMWIFLHSLVFSSDTNNRKQNFICILNWFVQCFCILLFCNHSNCFSKKKLNSLRSLHCIFRLYNLVKEYCIYDKAILKSNECYS